MVDKIDPRRLVLSDPCNRAALQRNFDQIANQLGDTITTINNIIDNSVVNNNETITIEQIITNNTFVTEVNNIVNNYLQSYFSSLYANTILFTLTSPMTYSAGTWSADASVGQSWLGIAPSGTVKILDPSGKWRWTALTGSTGIAIRANEAGTQYNAITIHTLADIIRFRVHTSFSKTDKAFKGYQFGPLFVNKLSPAGLWDPVWIANLPDTSSGYVFEGNAGTYGYAVLRWSETEPANNINDAPYSCIQLACP